ncbi:hypothetical protein I4U23_005215 [Adineta vaga]|nr:hypothetical protein I4U23_005215 [Adineta vaga]
MSYKAAKTSGRKQQAILNDLLTFDALSASAATRLPHDCYMILVGHITSHEDFDRLTKAAGNHDGSDDKQESANTNFTMMESEEMEYFLESATLLRKTAVGELTNDREHRFVYEDNFNPALLTMVKKQASFQQLKKVCRYYEKQKDVDTEKVMAEHLYRTEQSAPYFKNMGLSSDDSQGAALALSFYTGTKSELVSRDANIIARHANGEVIENKTVEEMHEAAVILYFLVKALSNIPYYWGYVTRAVTLTDEELKLYIPGCLVTWIQFSSSKKGKEVAAGFDFSMRNTVFKLYSLTGRPIGQFSNFQNEDEVLFLPHSTFFVFRHDTDYHGSQHIIYMRQVELGLCEWSVLWVDDRIFHEKWQNKSDMESAATRSMNLNVHFIPKTSTESALSFLRSPFGQRLKNKDKFRIVTDMNRENEKPVHNAGARFIKAVRRLGFKNACMVFTSDQRKAEQILRSELNSTDLSRVAVSDRTKDLRSFVNFEQTVTNPQQSIFKHSDESDKFQQSTYSKHETNSHKMLSATSNMYQGSSSSQYDETPNETDYEMMHNRMNTNIDILIRNCKIRNLADSRDNCVLLTTGSFNPVHPYHFQSLLRVKQYLENEHQPPWNVLAGYISPTHDSYVRQKLGDRAWIPANNRCRLCEGAIEYESEEISSWIRVSHGESEWSDGFVDFGPVTENFRDFLNSKLVGQGNIFKYPLRVVYVCGLDHYNKCSYVESMAKQKNMACAVVFRVGYDEKQISRSVKTTSVIYIPLSTECNKTADVSSTAIRQYFENPNTSKTHIERYIYPNVRDYMCRKYAKK